MSDSVTRELLIPQARHKVWRALTEASALEAWMYPNDFEPRVGHHFTFLVPPNPTVGFAGLTVHCEVLVCDSPRLLVFSWAADGLEGTTVSFRLEPEGDGTRLLFEHSGFDTTQKLGKQALGGANYGWTRMLDQLPAVVAGFSSNQEES